jgi:hypothetical protein
MPQAIPGFEEQPEQDDKISPITAGGNDLEAAKIAGQDYRDIDQDIPQFHVFADQATEISRWRKYDPELKSIFF